MMPRLTVALLLCWHLGNALGQDRPPLPYIDQGACPFECCTYGVWKARKAVIAYVEPKGGAAIAFRIKKRQQVDAQTGFVVTRKFGVMKVLKPIRLGYAQDSNVPNPEPVLDLKPGDLLYTLHYLGEGFDLFWYKGKLYSDQISSDKPDREPLSPELNVQTLSVPQSDWWVKVKTGNGQVGWIKNPPYFDNADSCG